MKSFTTAILILTSLSSSLAYVAVNNAKLRPVSPNSDDASTLQMMDFASMVDLDLPLLLTSTLTGLGAASFLFGQSQPLVQVGSTDQASPYLDSISGGNAVKPSLYKNSAEMSQEITPSTCAYSSSASNLDKGIKSYVAARNAAPGFTTAPFPSLEAKAEVSAPASSETSPSSYLAGLAPTNSKALLSSYAPTKPSVKDAKSTASKASMSSYAPTKPSVKNKESSTFSVAYLQGLSQLEHTPKDWSSYTPTPESATTSIAKVASMASALTYARAMDSSRFSYAPTKGPFAVVRGSTPTYLHGLTQA